MSLLRRYAMALLCGLFALGFGAASLLSAGLVERLFHLLGCVINAVLFGSWWAIERTFGRREHAAELFAAASELMSIVESGKPFEINGRTWVPVLANGLVWAPQPAAKNGPACNQPPADTGEEGSGT